MKKHYSSDYQPGRASAAADDMRHAATFERIYAIIEQIPAGKVATYGQIAAIEGRISPRLVGYALAALPANRATPWQRVINAKGTLSERRGGGGIAQQQALLSAEGVMFDAKGRVDFAQVGWDGPDWGWVHAHGFTPAPAPAGMAQRRASRS